MGFASYFLIVADFVRFARENGIIVGPGRGSAAGSIIAYLLGITDIDPLRYGLLFERFLNPGRRELPDIDMDFAPEDRHKIIDYIKSRYGHENVAQIITFTIMKARLVIRDVSRAMGIDLKTADTIAKRIPMSQIINITLKGTLKEDPDLKEIIEGDQKLKEMFNVAVNLEGLKRHTSKHAGGIVITDKPITTYAPIFVSRESEETTQYDMDSLQKLGLLKMDILGVETLSILDRALKLIEKQRGLKIKLEQIRLDDKITYEMLGNGLIRGVFQLEGSRSAKDLIKGMKPDRIEDILAAVALNRPGPMQTGMAKSYVEVKHGRQAPDYMHEILEEILKETNGAILYQEQVMMIANKMAGFSMSEADGLRKAMGKKRPEIMEEYHEKFVKGAVKNGVAKKVADDIFSKIEVFAGYAFNKSHSAAYGLITYYTAYMKANFPIEFMTVLFSSNISKPEKIAEYLDECKKLSIEVLPPDINESEFDFRISGEKIRCGLAVIKNIGNKTVESIVKVREQNGGSFSSFQQFCELMPHSVLDKRSMEQLIKCGAFDSLGNTRKALLDGYEEVMRLCGVKQKEQLVGQMTFFGAIGSNESNALSSNEEFEDEELLAFEKQALGVWIRSNPMEKYEIVSEFFASTTVDGMTDLVIKESRVTLVGVISNIRLKVIHSGPKRGAHYALVNIQDLTGSTEGVLFPTSLARNRESLDRAEDKVMFIRGSLDEREDARSLVVQELMPIDEAIDANTDVVVVKLKHDHPDEEIDGIKGLLQRFRGETPVVLEILSSDKERTTVGLAMQYSVKPSNYLALELERLVGRGNFKYVMKKWNGK
jgi:DNA polymerase-3 subunit alpha